MYMNKFLIFLGFIGLLAGCSGNKSMNWNDTVATSKPIDMQDSYHKSLDLYGVDADAKSANVAVLLPTSGSSKTVGTAIKTSIETAFIHRASPNIKVSFYDLSGNRAERNNVINDALKSNPDVIIGPLFAEDTKILRDAKPQKTPVISFTSDTKALGRGVVTMNLIPTQSIEAIVQQIQNDGIDNMIILAPGDNSGKDMTSVAKKSADLYDVETLGVFYYEPGKPDSIKDTAMQASLYQIRNAVNTRAREILSDILTKEELTEEEQQNLEEQLEKISRTETTGPLPYKSILFLGNGEDSKTLTSFLRYYGIGPNDAAFYGTAFWQNSKVTNDFAMSKSKYAALPEISDNYISLYDMIDGKEPDHLAAMGYDAANLALGLLFSQIEDNGYLYNPNGYIGTSGIFRILPSGESERALRIMELNGTKEPKTVKTPAKNFITPLYNVDQDSLKPVQAKELSTHGINPGDFIELPEQFAKKPEYKTKRIGSTYQFEDEEEAVDPESIEVFENTETETVSNPEFKPVKIETVSRQNIDEVEIEE